MDPDEAQRAQRQTEQNLRDIERLLRFLRHPVTIAAGALYIALWVADWGRARLRAERALEEEFERARVSGALGLAGVQSEAAEAWSLIAASPRSAVLESSSSATSGSLLPFAYTNATFCFPTEVETPGGPRWVDAVIEVETIVGFASVRWEGVSARRHCTCATGDDESCLFEGGGG
jgi:hypothetical protein